MPSKLAPIIAILLFLAAPARAQAPTAPMRLSLGYDGRLFVIKVLDLRFEQRLSATAYSAGAQLRSYGVLAAFKHFDIKASASGRLDMAGAQPAMFNYINRDGERERHVSVDWRADDVVASSQPAFSNLGDPPASREQRLAAADPLTELMRVTLAAPQRPCEGAPRLFDGKQLYELAFSDAHDATPADDLQALGVTRLVSCTVKYNEIAGFKKKKPAKRSSGLKGPITISFGQIGPDGPWVMADIRADTPLGPARILLRHAHILRGQS